MLAIILCALPLAAHAKTPRVVATIPPIHSLVAMVLEGIAEPDLIVKGFASPHDYAMAPSDASKVAHAEKEHKHTHEHHHDGPDQHFWLSPARAKQALELIATALTETLPAQSQRINTNKETALATLTALETELKSVVDPIRGKQAVVLHDAYSQFTEHFGLKPLIALSITPEHRPGPAQLRKIRHTIKEHNIRCVFREPQYPKRYTALLIEGSTAQEGTLDPLGGDLTPGAKLYAELMTRLATSLRNCMAP